MTTSKMKLSRDHVLKGLQELRDQKSLCDVHLVAEGATFPAHRVVLAAASPYFQTMFTGSFRENQMNEITLNDTSSKGLECALDAIYTGELLLSEENVCDVLPVASLLQLNEIIKHCTKYLYRNISTKSCLPFLSVAERYDLEKAVNKCNKFIVKNFHVVSQSTEFRSISREQLCTYISEESLKTSNGEIDVFRATLKWYEGNPSANTGKESDLADLMQHIRFPLIPTDLLLDEIQSSRLISENSQVMKMVTEALRFHSNDKVYLQPLKEGKQFQPRGEQKLALIQITPTSAGPVTIPKTKLHLLDMTGEEIFDTQLSEQPLQRVFHPCTLSIVAKGNYLFVFGAVTDSNRTIATRFDVKTNTWLDLKTPPLRA